MISSDEPDPHAGETEGLPVTQRDLARKLGLSQSTVSLALAGNPRISSKVKEQVRGAAEELGYRMDPRLSALASYRNKKAARVYRGNIAWVTNWPSRDGWRNPLFVDYYEGTREVLQRASYRLDTFWMADPRLSPEAFSRMLHTRGINGVVLAPQPRSNTTIELDLSDFAVVTFGHSLASPRFNTVRMETFSTISRMYQRLVGLGHRRIGLLLEEEVDKRMAHLILGAYLGSQQTQPLGGRVPTLGVQNIHEERRTIQNWLHTHTVDCVITTSSSLIELLEGGGSRIPEDFSVAVHLTDKKSRFGGIVIDNRRLGQLAGQRVISMIHNWESGIPALPENIAVEGFFKMGETIAPRHETETAGTDAT